MDAEQHYLKAIEEKDVQSILATMRSDVQSSAMQHWGCDALYQVVQHSSTAAKEVVANVGIEAVATAIRLHPENVEVVNDACTALWRVAKEGGYSACQAVIEQGGFEALQIVMKRHPEGSASHESAMLACGCLADSGLVSFGGAPKVQELDHLKHKGKAFATIYVVPEQGF
mmetsp:Transcript_2181/g.4064  ORF Transcript_2181/g.4064 Transcript_2181/m.4064 type:complete len:171 (-) Transcript_2181:48-560(-)|eukprot:CAMPEP_0197663420 /NCGR_PEP_ID=MMETSP1338-20131121/57331_1 /TAXON_ID=43686 ORGANISM="Pelagodinium beii, Strain RCC1491" /NCGR_SAMPLE_ID=MMETSP1338 /ASSEMBLY_ACC=CAM_ASM_000754 /LENGTH=170 /DNA_ID=CAMNT_0043241763 /DNA_START=29 /DNA_END=541 /DNA_ORIENTATION=-